MDDLQKWLHGIQNGDITAFEALYHEMKTPLFTIILRITREWNLSEDILQELFLKLYVSPPVPQGNPRAYLCRMAHNLALDGLRKTKPHDDLEVAERTVSHQVGDMEQRMDIEAAIKALPARELEIVTMHVNGDLKFQEIANIMELPMGTVLWAYRKAIKQLQRILGGKE